MPFPNEHAARQLPPGDFTKFRRSRLGFPKGISAIVGIRSNGKTAVQSLRFDRTKWTAAQARSWLKDHGFKSGLEVAARKSVDWTGVI